MTSLLIIIIYVGMGMYIGGETYNLAADESNRDDKLMMILTMILMIIWPLVVIGTCVFENQKDKSNGEA